MGRVLQLLKHVDGRAFIRAQLLPKSANMFTYNKLIAPGDPSLPPEASTAFFSYCREDSEFALRLAEDLKAAGANVWMDQLDIEPGMPWDRAVEDALAACTRLLVILSPVSVKSDNVRDEVSFCLSRQKRVIPVLYRECDVPFRLARLQHIDFRTDYARGCKLLIKTLGGEPQTAPSDAAARATTNSSEMHSSESLARPETGQNTKVWQVMGESVRGASHTRADLPNQDAIAWWPNMQKPDSVVCLAVSDGHGSAGRFRSHIGSQLAVRAALEEVRKFEQRRAKADLSISVERLDRQDLPEYLVRNWTEAVEKHLSSNPLSQEEAANVAAGESQITAYGATLLVVLISESEILYLQLGDGDILTVSVAGKAVNVKRPISADKRLFAGETTLLCVPEAWNHFRWAYHKLSGDAPLFLILVSTDGYSTSFRDEDAFKKVGSDIFATMQQPDGAATVRRNLAGWLAETTKYGSGDDISLGIIYREIPEGLIEG